MNIKCELNFSRIALSLFALFTDLFMHQFNATLLSVYSLLLSTVCHIVILVLKELAVFWILSEFLLTVVFPVHSTISGSGKLITLPTADTA
jgi:hypothetical protein